MLKFNGKPFNGDEFGRSLEAKAIESLVAQLRSRFETIRHPQTGEFPTVVALGDTLKDLKVRIEGSPELIKIIRDRHAPEDLEQVVLVEKSDVPRVFLSYASEDRVLAEQVATALQANGIDTWWAQWSIAAGDSLRQKIDEGLAGCTHFVVLLTPNSIEKPWVKQEMDAGLVRKLNDKAKFIPLRHQLTPRALPPTLSGLLSPEINAQASDIQQLINDIHGVTKKPPLGSAPASAHKSALVTGYSPAATAIAEMFVRTSAHALSHEPQMPISAVMEQARLSREDVVDAVHELSGMVAIHFQDTVWPLPALFAEFDRYWMPWNPEEDALKLSVDLVSDAAFPQRLPEIAQMYGWDARRLNPAVIYLKLRDAVLVSDAIGTMPWVAAWLQKTDKTRRYVKSRNV